VGPPASNQIMLTERPNNADPRFYPPAVIAVRPYNFSLNAATKSRALAWRRSGAGLSAV